MESSHKMEKVLLCKELGVRCTTKVGGGFCFVNLLLNATVYILSKKAIDVFS